MSTEEPLHYFIWLHASTGGQTTIKIQPILCEAARIPKKETVNIENPQASSATPRPASISLPSNA